MTSINIKGIPVIFPFQPYDIQKDYMEKVIETLQKETNAVLESPTGTGKTLSLLCSSLAWLVDKKRQCQENGVVLENFANKDEKFNKKVGTTISKFWGIPKIIYASRTHSQLTQAMQELKKTAYRHVKASILGSRDQMCIHPNVSQETNISNKIHMCRALVKSRSCYLQNRVEKMFASPEVSEPAVVDIEDLVKLGQKHKFCPYFMSRELQKQSDIIFLPYNYLLDPKARRAQHLDLKNSIIILDEAHNIERICEESASFQIRTTDLALCIEEVTTVMKYLDQNVAFISTDEMDFSEEDLILLKTILLNLENEIDGISISNDKEGSTYDGKFIFEIFGNVGINDGTQAQIIALLERLIQFLSTSQENPFQRTGTGLQMLQDLLLVVFQNVSSEFKSRINRCYKVHIIVEEQEIKKKQVDTWLSKASSAKSKNRCRILSYWCFSPGFGMNMLLEQGVRSVILTSGTLAPLRPLISELGINIGVTLENPHVVTKKQICIKIISNGPDGEQLNASYQNRNNANYITSLGITIMNLSRVVPDGMLIFFPSYPVMAKCQEEWQKSEIWSSLNSFKMVYVEPRSKDAFNKCMKEFYDQIKNPANKGAIFMAVCRGKVSEGLDFADINGRAVLVTGLPYPPLKDPRIILKRNYLDNLHSKDKEYLSGQNWYSLEATRAVNQAIGRVIRHAKDYGAILLLDSRFNSVQVKSQMSLWLRDLIVSVNKFGEFIRELKQFYKEAAENFPLLKESSLKSNKLRDNFEFGCSESSTSTSGLVTIHSKSPEEIQRKAKKRKFKLLEVDYSKVTVEQSKEDMVQFVGEIKNCLEKTEFAKFLKMLSVYRNDKNLNDFIDGLDEIFAPNQRLRMMLQGLLPYIKADQREMFQTYCDKMRRL